MSKFWILVFLLFSNYAWAFPNFSMIFDDMTYDCERETRFGFYIEKCVSENQRELERKILSRGGRVLLKQFIEMGRFSILLRQSVDVRLNNDVDLEPTESSIIEEENLNSIPKKITPYLRFGWYDIEQISPFIQLREDNLGYLGLTNFPNILNPIWEVTYKLSNSEILLHYNNELKLSWIKNEAILTIDFKKQVSFFYTKEF